ncbi:hypothetical protein BH09MYX1_BH09MYX1_25820 [soil metagenome]
MGAPQGESLSVVLVSWNGKSDTLRCLASLARQTDRDFEIVVVDNGSTDGTVLAVREEFPSVHVIEAGQNLGFAEGCNRGIDATTSTWIATLNNDTIADPHWIAELRREAALGPATLGMLQSHVLFLDDDATLNSTGVELFTSGSARDRSVGQAERSADPPRDTFCATAGAALFRRAMLDDIRLASGVFDRTFFMYFEDVDLGWRCRLAGWSARYVRSAIVRHAFQASSKKREGRFIGIHLRRNRMRMLLKNGSGRFVARTLPQTLYDVCELVVWEGVGVLPSIGEAVRDGVRQRREVTRTTGATAKKRRDVEARWLTDAGESLRDEILLQLGKVFRRGR